MSAIDPAKTPSPYAVVHLVVQEATKPLIESQVVDHMNWQASAPGSATPAKVIVVLLEPLRTAIRPRLTRHIRKLRQRAPNIAVTLWPYVGRLGLSKNARLLAGRLRRLTGGSRVVFHCRNESATEWGLALRNFVENSAVVADIRGPWAEERLFERQRNHHPDRPSALSIDYEQSIARLRRLTADTSLAMTVSQGMIEWLADKGIRSEGVVYVPCCVQRVTFDSAQRAAARHRLRLDRKTVFVYLGSVDARQYLVPEVIPFVREAMRQRDDVHLLAITPNIQNLRALLAAEGIPNERATICSAPQRDVAPLLAAGDAGLIMVRHGPLASLVQPVKFAEYLAAGLPVVVSRSARCVASLVSQYGAGLVVDVPSDRPGELSQTVQRTLECMSASAPEMRANAIRLCTDELLWSAHTDVVRQSYIRALESTGPDLARS